MSLNLLTWLGVNASPLVKTWRTEARLVCADPSAAPLTGSVEALLRSKYSRNTLSIDGTKCITVTRCFLTVSTIVMGFFSPPGIRKQSLAPGRTHQKSSHTETSKV